MFTDMPPLSSRCPRRTSQRCPPRPSTFGYHRAEILAALINALVLLGVCGYLAYAGVTRCPTLLWSTPGRCSSSPSSACWRTVVAHVLRRSETESLNMRGAFLEVLGDPLGSVAAIVGRLVIVTTGSTGPTRSPRW